MSMITTKDGTEIYYKDGARESLSFSATVGLSRRIAGRSEMFFLASKELPLHRPRPPRPRPFQPALGW